MYAMIDKTTCGYVTAKSRSKTRNRKVWKPGKCGFCPNISLAKLQDRIPL